MVAPTLLVMLRGIDFCRFGAQYILGKSMDERLADSNDTAHHDT